MLGAGILKPLAFSSVLIGGAKKIARIRPGLQAKLGKEYTVKGMTPWLSSILQAPQRELSRIKSIKPYYELGELGSDISAQFHRRPPRVELSMATPVAGRSGSIWHELVHGRQYVPRSFSERSTSLAIKDLDTVLRQKAAKAKISADSYYWNLDPYEIQARAVERRVRLHLASGKGMSRGIYDRIFEESRHEALNTVKQNADVILGRIN